MTVDPTCANWGTASGRYAAALPSTGETKSRRTVRNASNGSQPTIATLPSLSRASWRSERQSCAPTATNTAAWAA